MSQPPRLNHIFVKGDLTYFVTFCLDRRVPLLANPSFFQVSSLSLKRLKDWHVWSGVIMPDHVHLLVSPLKSDHSISNFSAAFKRWTRESSAANWKWQKGCFDRLLRDTEHGEQKWAYIRENPVRAGLVSRCEDWPYRFDWKGL